VLVGLAAESLVAPPEAFAEQAIFLGKWGSFGTDDGQFSGPFGVAVAPDGTVYVADTYNHRIQHFSAAGDHLSTWGGYGGGDGEFSWPYSVAVAPDGTVYVTDLYNSRIQHFSATGAFLGKWGGYGTDDGQFNMLRGVAVAPNGTVYVADTDNNRIQHFSATGAFLGKWGSLGAGDGEFKSPYGVDVAPDGTVYVADTNNHRIQHFSATGAFLGKWGGYGSGDGEFSSPYGVAVAPDGTVYAVDRDNERVQHFSATGAFLGKWGSYGSGDGEFSSPYGVAVASDGTVYVTDDATMRVQYFSVTGVSLEHDAAGVVFDRFVTGYSTTYSGGGYVYGRWTGTVLKASFTGSGIMWVGPKQPGYGMADVWIDGAKVATDVDCYRAAPGTLSAVIWQSATLVDGPHTIELRLTGHKNAASSGYVVVVDKFEVTGAAPSGPGTRYDDSTATPGYTGTWLPYINPTYFNKTYAYSRWTNAAFTVSFTGAQVSWIGPRTPNYGIADVYVDDAKVATVDCYRANLATQGWREVVWTSDMLAPGAHTLSIRPTGTKNAAATAANVVIDAIDVTP